MVLVSLHMAATVRATTENQIGLYFDEAGTSNCIVDVASYPIQRQAYLILKDANVDGGIAAWEGSIKSDSTLIVIPTGFGVECINVGMFPEFQVGYASPVAGTGSVLLATFKIIAMDAGRVYFGAISHPSIPGGRFPAMAPGSGSSQLVEMSYAYGDTNLPVAVIGDLACPIEPALYLPGGGEAQYDENDFLDPATIARLMVKPGGISINPTHALAAEAVPVEDLSLGQLFHSSNALAITRSFPSFDNSRLVRQNDSGKAVRLIDMSNIFDVLFADSLSCRSFIDEARNLNGVIQVGPFVTSQNHDAAGLDPLYFDGEQWALHNYGQHSGAAGYDIGASRAWKFTTGDSRVKVGIVDEPIDPSVPELAGRLAGYFGSAETDHVHATRVASVFGANQDGVGMVGADWHATILSLPGGGPTTDRTEAIYNAIDLGADILVHSYSTDDWLGNPGISFSNMIACCDAYRMGILNVCSAGNDGVGTLSYPGGFVDNVTMAVGGITRYGNSWSGSNWGSGLDLVAPALDVQTANPGPGYGYSERPGTSYAAPLVAGVASLLLAENIVPANCSATPSADDLREILKLSALDMGPIGYDEHYGNGLVQADAAIRALKPPYVIVHGDIYSSSFVEVGSLGPYTTRLYGFDGLYDGALCRVTFKMMRAENVPVCGQFYDLDETKVWCRGDATLGYSYHMPIYEYGYAAMSSSIAPGGLIGATTFVLHVTELDHGRQFVFPPTGPRVAYTAWGKSLDIGPAAVNEDSGGIVMSVLVSPNPFNASVALTIGGGEGQNLDVHIYDARGYLVRDLFAGPNGEPVKIEWDGTDDLGRSMPAGTYFAVAESGASRSVKKLALVK